jgi:hypothetical protein
MKFSLERRIMNDKAEQKRSSQPNPTPPPGQQRSKEHAGGAGLIGICGAVGAAAFCILNITTGIVPGGFIGGGIGGALGGVVGMILDSLRKK